MGLMDEFQALKSISVEELEEQAFDVDYLTPREFAKLLSVHPQQIYTWIRKGILEAERCKCGRTVLCVSKSRATLDRRNRALGRIVDPTLDPKNVEVDERGRQDVSSTTEAEASMAEGEEVGGGIVDASQDT